MIPDVFDTGLVGLLDRQMFLPVALLLAVLLGAGHACAPGHGKTLAAGYLVAGRGRPRDAVGLGLIVAVMHTVSVLLLGMGWYVLAEATPDMAAVTRWLQLAAALLVVAVGASMVHRQLWAEGRSSRRDHRHPHGDGHGHDHGHAAMGSLLNRRGLVALGVSGGLLPSPTAFLVLVTGLLTGQVLVAGLLIAAFGLGMAVILGGLGLAVVRGRDVALQRLAGPRLRTWARRVPAIAAGGVLAGGVVYAVVAAARLVSPVQG